MKRIAAIAAVLGALTLVNQSAYALARIWANTGTDYNASASWNAGAGPAPGAGDVGEFNAAEVTQPNLSASLSNAGIYFAGTGTSGYDLTNTNSATLTLTGSSTSGSGGTSNSSAAAIRSEATSGTNTIDVPLILAPATGTLSTFFNTAGGTLVVNGPISGSGIALSLKAGTIQLNGNNSFSGGASIDASSTTLVLGNDNALGTGTFSVNNTATLQAGGGNRTLANNIVLAGQTTISGSNAFTFNGSVTSSGSNSRTLTVSNTGGVTMGGTVNLEESGAPAGRVFTVNGSSQVTINGVVQDGSAQPAILKYSGTSILTLGNTNTYSGGTQLTVAGGTIVGNKDGAFGTGNVSLLATTVTLTLQNGATNNYINNAANLNIGFTTDVVNLNYNGSDTIGSLTVNGVQEAPGIYGSAASGAANVLPEFTGTGTLTVLAAIPEPSTAMLLSVGLLIGAQQLIRRKRS